MTEEELQKRNEGFMTAVGLLLMNSDADVQEEIKAVLNSFGANLHRELEDDRYQQLAAAAGTPDACPEGMRWDPVLKQCIAEP